MKDSEEMANSRTVIEMPSFGGQQIDQKKENETVLPILNSVSCLMSLALFGILGVISRYYLEKLFGPDVIGATSDHGYMYYDLPSNMVGSFLMGWLGVVFKGDIAKVSDNLAVGLTTGFLGSLTTFSGWNQKLVELSVEHRWVFSILIILIGFMLVEASIERGIETAESLKLQSNKWSAKFEFSSQEGSCNLQHCLNCLTTTLLMAFVFALVMIACTILAIREFNNDAYDVKLLLACIFGPFGVWTRYFLARLFNDHRGLGQNSWLKWVPFGTLAANVLAASTMATLAALKKAIKDDTFDNVATAMQLGFCGCLSTVSTLVAEHNKLKRSGSCWRAYSYVLSTIKISFVLGMVLYTALLRIKERG